MQALVCQTHQALAASPPGAIVPFWRDADISALAVRCPGCGHVTVVHFQPHEVLLPGPKGLMVGFPDAITLKKDFLCENGCRWKGWLIRGEWRPC